MSEWWSVVAVFWALYLADGVIVGRRERLFLSSWRGGASWRFWRGLRRDFWRSRKPVPDARTQPARTAGLTQGTWHFTPPWPWAYALALDDLPAGLGREGLGNWPVVSTSRPPPLPEMLRAVRWEDAENAETRGGWLMLGGRKFAPVTEALDARELRRLAERLRPLGLAERAKVIADWQARRFSGLRARRRLAVALRRTRGLARMNTLQGAGWLAVSAGLLSGRFEPASPTGEIVTWRHLDSGQAAWWLLLAWLVIAHGFAVFEAWRLHRRLHPTRKEERANLVFTALMLPPQGLRLRAAVMKPLARDMAPLAGALAAGTPTTARSAAQATWRDVCYPVRPATLPVFIAAVADEAAALARPAVERALADATLGGGNGLRPEELLAPPGKFGRGVCAYCPRCGDEFVRADGVCPQGVALRRIESAPRRA